MGIFGGSGSGTQGQIAAGLLAQYDRPLAVLFISKADDWQFRQKVQYEAVKGLMRPDFISLDDFFTSMDTMMKAGSVGQKIGWPILKNVIKLQPKLMLKLIPDPQMGLIGRFLRTLAGFTKLFVSPLEIITDQKSLTSRLGGF